MEYFVRLKNHRLFANDKDQIFLTIKTEAGDTIKVEMHRTSALMIAVDLDKQLLATEKKS
jgi:hypothetical protein